MIVGEKCTSFLILCKEECIFDLDISVPRLERDRSCGPFTLSCIIWDVIEVCLLRYLGVY